jgi:hypothetical protein
MKDRNGMYWLVVAVVTFCICSHEGSFAVLLSLRSPDKSKKARLIDTLDDLLDSKTKPTKTKEERVPQYVRLLLS